MSLLRWVSAMSKDTPQVDHKAEALDLLSRARKDFADGYKDGSRLLCNRALVHSNLAIAEGQERVAEEIKAFRELWGGTYA